MSSVYQAFSGNTALHFASSVHGRLTQVDAVKLLMRRGADPSSKNLENEQPAQLVAEGPVGDQVNNAPKWFFGCPPSVEMALRGTQKGSTWN